MRTKEKFAMTNLIYKDYCMSTNAVNSGNDLLDVNSSMINLDCELVNYLDKDSEDEEMDNNNTATERMQMSANNEYNSLL